MKVVVLASTSAIPVLNAVVAVAELGVSIYTWNQSRKQRKALLMRLDKVKYNKAGLTMLSKARYDMDYEKCILQQAMLIGMV